jgi:ankyrin repeat protein
MKLHDIIALCFKLEKMSADEYKKFREQWGPEEKAQLLKKISTDSFLNFYPLISLVKTHLVGFDREASLDVHDQSIKHLLKIGLSWLNEHSSTQRVLNSVEDTLVYINPFLNQHSINYKTNIINYLNFITPEFIANEVYAACFFKFANYCQENHQPELLIELLDASSKAYSDTPDKTYYPGKLYSCMPGLNNRILLTCASIAESRQHQQRPTSHPYKSYCLHTMNAFEQASHDQLISPFLLGIILSSLLGHYTILEETTAITTFNKECQRDFESMIWTRYEQTIKMIINLIDKLESNKSINLTEDEINIINQSIDAQCLTLEQNVKRSPIETLKIQRLQRLKNSSSSENIPKKIDYYLNSFGLKAILNIDKNCTLRAIESDTIGIFYHSKNSLEQAALFLGSLEECLVRHFVTKKIENLNRVLKMNEPLNDELKDYATSFSTTVLIRTRSLQFDGALKKLISDEQFYPEIFKNADLDQAKAHLIEKIIAKTQWPKTFVLLQLKGGKILNEKIFSTIYYLLTSSESLPEEPVVMSYEKVQKHNNDLMNTFDNSALQVAQVWSKKQLGKQCLTLPHISTEPHLLTTKQRQLIKIVEERVCIKNLSAASLFSSLNENLLIHIFNNNPKTIFSFLTSEKKTLLHYAAINGYGILCNLLVHHGVDFYKKDSNGKTAFHEAVIGHQTDLVRSFLKYAVINLDDSFAKNTTALTYAVEHNFIDIVELILKHQALTPKTWNVQQEFKHFLCFYPKEEPDSMIKKAMSSAYEKYKEEIMILLIQYGYDWNLWEKRTHLLCWSIQENYSNLAFLLLTQNLPLEEQDHLGRTPILLASELNKSEFVLMLLSYGARADVSDRKKRSPLYWAARHGQIELVRFLLQQTEISSSFNPCIEGSTPLCWAIHHGDIEMVTLFLDYQKNNGINFLNNQLEFSYSMNSPLQHHQHHILGLLLEYNFQVHTPAIRHQATQRTFSLTEWILQSHSDALIASLFNKIKIPREIENEFVLHWAIKKNYTQVFLVALEQYLDAINNVDYYGNTLLQFAIIYHRSEVVQALIEKSADTTQVNTEGHTALALAIEVGSEECFRPLLAKEEQRSPQIINILNKLITQTKNKFANKIIGYLIRHIGDGSFVLSDGRHLLQHAIDRNDHETIMVLLQTLQTKDLSIGEFVKNHRFLPSSSRKATQPVLSWVVVNGYLQEVAHLFEKIDPHTKINHKPLLHWAVEKQAPNVVSRLLERGASDSLYKGHYAIEEAIKNDDQAIISLLLSSNQYETSVRQAIEHNPSTTQLLFETGCFFLRSHSEQLRNPQREEPLPTQIMQRKNRSYMRPFSS